MAWGPNNRFVFPARGGTGEIYRRLAGRFCDRIRYRCDVGEIDPGENTVRLSGGEALGYTALVSTMPLSRLVERIRECPSAVRRAAGRLVHNGVFMVGVGYEAPLRDEKSWMYFPDPTVPFYRATNFAKYAAANVPGDDTSRFSSYMTETSYSSHRPVPRSGLEERVQAGLRAGGLVPGGAEVASIHVEDIPFAYPVPTIDRDRALSVIQPWLTDHRILARGRFGSWRYEIGNMDHAVKMGIDAARRLVTGAEEELWRA